MEKHKKSGTFPSPSSVVNSDWCPSVRKGGFKTNSHQASRMIRESRAGNTGKNMDGDFTMDGGFTITEFPLNNDVAGQEK